MYGVFLFPVHVLCSFQGYCLLYESMLPSVIQCRDKWLKSVSFCLRKACTKYQNFKRLLFMHSFLFFFFWGGGVLKTTSRHLYITSCCLDATTETLQHHCSIMSQAYLHETDNGTTNVCCKSNKHYLECPCCVSMISCRLNTF